MDSLLRCSARNDIAMPILCRSIDKVYVFPGPGLLLNLVFIIRIGWSGSVVSHANEVTKAEGFHTVPFMPKKAMTFFGSVSAMVSSSSALLKWMMYRGRVLFSAIVPIAGLVSLFSPCSLRLFWRAFVRAYAVRATFNAHGVPSTDKRSFYNGRI